MYDLSLISSFLGENDAAIEEVLDTFIASTYANMDQLKAAVENSNYGEINHLSHKMLPMFRQLKVTTVVPDLEILETAKQKYLSCGGNNKAISKNREADDIAFKGAGKSKRYKSRLY